MLAVFFAGMTELDLVWSQMLDEAAVKADAAGRRDVAEYLRLKATNDAIRRVGVGWLMDSFVELAMEHMHSHKNLKLEREDSHQFKSGNSTMVGPRVRLYNGVRCLTVEAGWTRAPSHGIMRRGMLAFARLSHFGLPKSGIEIRLVHGPDLPHWLDDSDAAIGEEMLRRHISLLLS